MGVVDMKFLIEDCVSSGEGEAPTFYAYAMLLIILGRLPEIIKQGLEAKVGVLANSLAVVGFRPTGICCGAV